MNRAWGSQLAGDIRNVPLPPPNSGLWSDVAAIDRARFEIWLTRRWNEAHVRAIRQHDTRHPIMSEYYQRPSGGLDLPLTIDGQDVSDVGYFDEPLVDLERLPLALRWNDLRARGKGLSLGEYGVKTHPAWTVENGATHYHLRRSEEEQKQLFAAVAHYALGMGAAKVQNWCLQDAQSRVFPWGIFYPNEHVPKDVAFVHRNQSVIWRFFRPKYVPPELTLCMADQLRMGNREQVGLDVAYRAIADLLAGHYDFNVINDHHLDALPTATRVLFYPSPFSLREETYRTLLAWVRGGGTLLVTGDLSYDENRQPTQRGRLGELLGVEFVAERYPHIDRHLGGDTLIEFPNKELGLLPLRPCIDCRETTAEVLARTVAGSPVLTRHTVGSGVVFWLADPIELDGDPAARTRRQAVYRALLAAAGARPLPVEPNAPWLHVMAQPTARGVVHVVFNTQRAEGRETVSLPTAAGQVQLCLRNQWPGLVAVTQDRRIVAVSTDGQASVLDQSLLGGQGLKAALALDALDLRQSAAILVGPFEPGSLVLPPRTDRRVVCCGEFRDGQWTTLEQLAAGCRASRDRDRCGPRDLPAARLQP